MTNIILFDEGNWQNLLPFTYTRPVSEIRVGILTIKEKWEHHLQGKASYITTNYLSEKYPIEIADDNIVVFSSLLPAPALVDRIKSLQTSQAIVQGDRFLAARLDRDQFILLMNNDANADIEGIDITKDEIDIQLVTYPEHIYMFNKQELIRDYQLLTKGRTSQPLSSTNTILGEQIFVEEGADVECAILNAKDAPIYIGKQAKIMEGAMVRKGLALCDGAIIKMGAKIYGATTIGPKCKAGGEINNSVLFANSNKGHDGYLGNSVLGEWCNLGADTNTSNLKNNYSEVKIWDYEHSRFRKTGQMFCGLLMGDHSKCGINTMFNTGTIVGICANVFGDGYPRTFIPSFSWGGASGFQTNKVSKAIEVAEVVMPRRDQQLTESDEHILRYVYSQTSHFRKWEKK